VHAALNSGVLGKKSFLAWVRTTELTAIDYPSQKMLSALGHHLREDAVSIQIRKAIKFTWLRSQILLQSGFRAETALRQAGIQAIWIKGVAVLARTTTSVGTRPMEDVDLLIPLESVALATRALITAGFHSDADRELLTNPELITTNLHSIAFRDEFGAEVDVHWQGFKGKRSAAAEEGLLTRSLEIPLGDRWTQVVSPEDLLVQIIATNREGNDAYWVLDAVRVIQDNVIDFELVLRIAEERELRPLCSAALLFLDRQKPGVISTSLRFKVLPLAVLEAAKDIVLKNALVSNLIEMLRLGLPGYIEIPSFHGSEQLLPDNIGPSLRRLPSQSISVSFAKHKGFRSPFALANWHQAEEFGNWSSSKIAHTQFGLADEIGAFRIQVVFHCAASKFAVFRRVGVYANGVLVDRKLLVGKAAFKSQVSEFEHSRSNSLDPLTVSFAISSVIVPRKHQMSLDQRSLGIFLQQIIISRNI
tara:strand:- start:4910 stop:6334 length:1425 start_codon:yes stop_codon:yes gene_type:complete